MRAYWCFYFSYLDNIKRLSMEERGRLFTALTLYARDGEVPEDMSERLEIAFDAIQPQIDRDKAEYEAKCERNKKSVSSRYERIRTYTNEYERIRTNTNVCKEKEKEKDKDKDKEKDNNNPARESTEEDEKEESEFELFWEAYPNKKRKNDARSAWHEQRPDLGVCLRAIEEQAKTRQWTEDGGTFIPFPANWLTAHRWEDVVTPADKRRGTFDQRTDHIDIDDIAIDLG